MTEEPITLTPEEEFLNSILSDEAKRQLLARNAPCAPAAEAGPNAADTQDASNANSEYAAEDEADSEAAREARQREEEHAALASTFAFIRSRSGEGLLTTYANWEEASLAPAHLDSVSFTQLVFDTIIAAQADEDAAAQADESVSESENAQTGADAAHGENESPQAAENPSLEADSAAVAAEKEPEPEAGLAPAPALSAQEAQTPAWELDDIRVLEGKDTYLYSNAHMTDAYAHWAFLAAEDDDVLTLVDNARTESRIYPRPMLAASLRNRPYRLSAERIAAAFTAVQESGLYPDIQTCSASNGDVYYYSSDFLSPAQANALAEWFSVERGMNV